MTLINFVILYVLQGLEMLDPSERPRLSNVTADHQDFNLPLRGVCEAQSKFREGAVIFAMILGISLGGVIFGTSEQSLSTIMSDFGIKKKPAPVVVASTRDDSLTLQTPGKMKRAKTMMEMPVAVPRVTKKDRLQGHCCLFFSYLLVIFILMILFSTVPLASHNAEQPRNETGWRRACDDNDLRVLDTWGLS